MTAENEKFDVLVNEKPVEFIQSIDEYGNWHVAFGVDGSSQSKIMIGGFENSAPQTISSQSGQSDADENQILLYYVVPIAAAMGIGAYIYARRKAKTAS
jgi:hypothetical protein